MQTYTRITNEFTGVELPGKIDENLQSLKSDFSGTAFPTESLVEGMTCYRTDLDTEYRYVGGAWKVSGIATQAQAEEGADNTKIMTPLRAKNAINKQRPIKTFTSLSQIGLDNNASIEGICNALPSNSMLIVDIIRSEYPNILTPGLDGLLKITKKNNLRCALEYCAPESGTYMKYESGFASWASPNFYGWVQINTMPIATKAQAEAGTDNTTVMTPLRTKQALIATNRLSNTVYNVGEVLFHKSNLAVALKCTTAGTTSADELDISGNNVTDSVPDGSVVWKVIARNLDAGLTSDGFSLSVKREDGGNDNFVITNVADNGVFFETYKGAITGDNLTARLALRHESNETRSGWFELEASDGKNEVSLIGKPNKELLWDGKEIALVPNVQSNNIVTISPTIKESDNVSVSALFVTQIGNMVTIRAEVTLKANQSDWFYFARGIPKPAGTSSLYNTATTWNSSYVRAVRFAVTIDGYLGIRYGGATTYAYSFTYITDEGV